MKGNNDGDNGTKIYKEIGKGKGQRKASIYLQEK